MLEFRARIVDSIDAAVSEAGDFSRSHVSGLSGADRAALRAALGADKDSAWPPSEEAVARAVVYDNADGIRTVPAFRLMFTVDSGMDVTIGGDSRRYTHNGEIAVHCLDSRGASRKALHWMAHAARLVYEHRRVSFDSRGIEGTIAFHGASISDGPDGPGHACVTAAIPLQFGERR